MKIVVGIISIVASLLGLSSYVYFMIKYWNTFTEEEQQRLLILVASLIAFLLSVFVLIGFEG